jgi:unsaturated rhamnogalacturonyl hydrolase
MNHGQRIATVALMLLLAVGCASSSPRPQPTAKAWSTRMADSVLARNPDPLTLEGGKRARPNWSYSTAFLVQSVALAGVANNDPRYLDYARSYADAFLDSQGVITAPTYRADEHTLDDVAPARLLLLLNQKTSDARYRKAADQLATNLRNQPRTSEGGFWHKKVYPQQMWLDGIFMACPFMSEYGALAHDAAWQDEAATQILLIARHTRDGSSGLFYHGWDSAHKQPWANKETGLSQCIWGRAMGWYAMGIVETLEELPVDYPRRAELIKLFAGLADALAKVQDPATGVWYQVLDQPTRAGNYLESSASCMFVYALAKGVRLGYLNPSHAATVRKGYDGILRTFITTEASDGTITLTDTCQVAGLGGRPRRDGSFEYYMSERRISNDPKGVAPFILASLEIERMPPNRSSLER